MNTVSLVGDNFLRGEPHARDLPTPAWALSPQVERYLREREGQGRHELGPADVQAIRDLPGENYLLDFEFE